MTYPGPKRAVAIAILAYTIFFMVPIILGVLMLIAFEFWGLHQLKESINEQIIFLAILVCAFIIFMIPWIRLVLSRNWLARLLKADGLDILEFNGKHIIAQGEKVRVSIDFDSPFMDYNPIPRARIVRENRKPLILYKGSFDPRYMYRLSRMCIEVPCLTGGGFRSELNRRLSTVLPDEVLESVSEDQSSMTIVVKWGSWLGDSVMGMIRAVVECSANSMPLHE